MTDFPGSPFAGLAPNLIPHPPAEIPEAPGVPNAAASASPFSEALDVDEIIKNLTLDRPLSLYIPNRQNYPDWEFHIINSIPKEIADAKNKGFREITDPDMVMLFKDLVAGTDKEGKVYRPMLMARPKKIGEIVRKRQRQQLASLYAGMDPKNKDVSGKYTSPVDARDGTFLSRGGDGWRIRTG
jgi:hypothetical protein